MSVQTTTKPTFTEVEDWQPPINQDNQPIVKPTPVNDKKNVQPGSAPSQPAAPKPLTRKQQVFVKHLIDNPKISATEAAAQAYDVTTRHSAEVIAHENLRKPEIMLELAKHSQTAELVMLEVMNTSNKFSKTGDKAGASYASVALQAADKVLDRLHGKAITKVEQRSEVVTLNIDLSGA